ncbi:FecR/PupR family sigma factor regulator [Pseudomonas sp. 15A4]|uniref:FecR/PupR family sigma factor regulator n=1 Tax=Pseudomonas sp. 15A4 TaxID=2804761 RepID=UPI001967AF5A|nr:FecR/PupR family sigma factor regulator [Pseudomonas sp. 15A4]QSB21019.1 FecR/PupR family sigma factor regulator [Pseudomonas sp. 15A4]
MDQALTWLIELEIADIATHARFLEWLDADPAHREAFASAEAVWHSQPLFDAAEVLAVRKKPDAGLRSPTCGAIASNLMI